MQGGFAGIRAGVLGVAAALALGAGAALADTHDLTTAHGISAFGDLKYPAGFQHFDYANPDAPKGGKISFRGTGASRTFDSLNPFILAGESAQGIGRIYDSLLVRSYDEPDAVYGLLAESVTYPADRSWVIYTLRPEARFADGVPLTAADVVFTLTTLKEKGSPVYKILLGDVATVEALGPRQVKVAFAEGVPTRDLISEIGQLDILPAHYYDTVDFERSTLDPPLGSGPYVVSNVDAGKSITYCLNPGYWATDLPVNVGTNNFGCVIYEYFAENTTAFEALKVGDYLFHEENTSSIWATGYDFPALTKGWVVREEIPDARSSGAQGFWLNLRRPHLQDPRVREAIGLMFNFEWSNETLFYGLYKRTDSFWENTSMQAEGLLQGEELAFLERFRDGVPPEVFTEPAYTPPVNSTQATDRTAVRAAGALLDDAGWTVGADGMRRNATGEMLTVEFVTDSQAFERIVLPFIDNLRKAGVDAVYTKVDPAQSEQRQEDFDYDIMVARLVLAQSPSVELRTLFGTRSIDAKGTLNLAGAGSPTIDAIIEEIIAADSRAVMETRVRALDRVLRAQHIWVPNWYKGSHWLAYWDVFGKPATKPLYDRGVDFWWFDQAKYDALLAQGALR